MPEWDLDVYFPGLDSPSFMESHAKLRDEIAEFDRQLAVLEGATTVSVGQLAGLLEHLNALEERRRLLDSYVYGKLTVNTRDALAQARTSELERDQVPLRQAMTRFEAWVGKLDLEPLISASDLIAEHAYLLRRAQERAKHQMSPAEESLAAELYVTGASAWSRLHGNVTSQLEVTLTLDGETKTIPMSAVRNLAHNANRETRRVAYEAELAAWKTVETPLAAAMNSIKGEVATLCRRRNWGTGLEEAVFENAIDRDTLDAMLAAAREAFPDFRRFLHAKAKVHGIAQLEWYDMFAPVEFAGRTWTYDVGCDFVAETFDAYSSKMGDFARRSFRERWTDFAPRPGKVDGAYCMGTRDDESRILMNYEASFGSVKTLAHELGHAYHNLCLSGRSTMVRETPSTLAETASIFCETVVKNAALETVSGAEKLALLDACIQGPCQTVVDISSRFIFEKAVFDGRIEREFTADEFCELMLNAQKDTYGDGLASYHPYMWAMKPHYYSSWSFYNFPYMFGLLFALGLYAQYRQDPDNFRGRYDDLLSSTGMADAYALGQRFGFNTRGIEFWRGSLDVLRADIAEYEVLVGSA